MKKILVILFASLLFGCDKEYEIRTADLDPPVCTGFYLTDEDGYHYKTIGYPNVKLNDSPDGKVINSTHQLATFPNPAYFDRLYFTLISKVTPQKKSVWIVSAAVGTEMEPMYQIMNSSYLVAGGSPVFSYENFNSGIIMVDVKNIPDGYYRIYCKVDDVLLWDNIIILKDKYENTGYN